MSNFEHFDPSITILDKNAAKYLDVLQVALLRIGKCTILPELYEIFGQDNLLKFLDIFSGVNVQIPSRSALEHAVRDTYIFMSIKRLENCSASRAEMIKTLARRYSISDDRVRSIFLEMRSYLDNLNVEVKAEEKVAYDG